MPLRSLPRPLAVLVKDPNKLDLMRSLSQSDEGAINIKARDGSCFSYAPILAAILFLLQILRAQEIMHHFTTLILIPLQMFQKDVVLGQYQIYENGMVLNKCRRMTKIMTEEHIFLMRNLHTVPSIEELF